MARIVLLGPRAERSDAAHENPLRVVVGREEVTRYVDEGMSFSSVDPGGFETASFTFPRSVTVRRGEPVRIFSGLATAWQGRVGERTGGDGRGETQISCEGAGSVLKDDETSMVYVDRELQAWAQASRQRQIDLVGANVTPTGPEAASDPTGAFPALRTRISGSWVSPRTPRVEGLYDAGDGNVIAAIYHDTVAAGGPSAAGAWAWGLAVAAGDTLTGLESSANYPAAGYFSPAARRRFAAVHFAYTVTPAGADGANYDVYWRNLAVYGDHGLPRRGNDPGGFYPSDVIRHQIGQVAGIDNGVIEDATGYIIPHMAYRERVAREQIIADAAKYIGWHWGTWEPAQITAETPRFDFRPYPTDPTIFVSRSDCDGLDLSETLATLFDRVAVAYSDPAGSKGVAIRTRVVPELADLGLTRTLLIDGGTMTLAAAQTYGDFVLELQERTARVAGSCTLPGIVRTPGGPKLAHLIHPGLDRLRITDLPAEGPLTSPERLDFHVRRAETTASSSGLATRVELGSGANLLEVLQARLSSATDIAGA